MIWMPLFTVAGTVIVELMSYAPATIWATGWIAPDCSALAAFFMACWTEHGKAVVQAVPNPVGDASKICRLLFGGVPGRVGMVGLIVLRATTWSLISWQCGPPHTGDAGPTPPGLIVQVPVPVVKVFPNEKISPPSVPFPLELPDTTTGPVEAVAEEPTPYAVGDAVGEVRTILSMNTTGP